MQFATRLLSVKPQAVAVSLLFAPTELTVQTAHIIPKVIVVSTLLCFAMGAY